MGIADLTGRFAYNRPFYWSRQKLEILEKYAKAATPILSKIGHHKVTFVDLMAAGGYYASGEPGSTGHLAEIAKENRNAGRDVRCIAYEIEPTMFAQLEASTADAREFVTVRNAAWETQVPQLLRELDGSFAVFFIDPIGLREVSWKALAPIIRRPYSEVLINFPSVTAARLAGRWLRGSATAAGSKARLDTVFGDESRLVGIEGLRGDDGQMHDHLAEVYAERVRVAGSYKAAFWQVIRADGAAGKPKYHIMFASRDMTAFELMNGILAGQSERLKREHLGRRSKRTIQMAMSFEKLPTPEQAAEALVLASLADSLVADPRLRGQRMTIEAMFATAYTSRFGEYRKTLYRAAATSLDEQKRIIVHDRGKGRGGLPWAAVIEFPST